MRGSVLFICALFLFAGAGQIPAQNVEYVGSTLWGGDNDVEVVGDYAYCAFVNGLMVLDVSDPDSPAFVSQLFIQGNGEGIDVEGDYAYLADGRSGLQVIDISDPWNPGFVGACETSGYATNIFVCGNYAYIVEGSSYYDSQGYHGLEIFDIEDPYNPAFAGGYETPGWPNSVFVSGDYAYVVNYGWSGLLILDVSDPANPFPTGSHDTDFSAGNVFVSGEYAYAAEAGGLQGEIEIFDVSDPYEPFLVAGYNAEHSYYDVFVAGNYAYAAFTRYDGSGLEIIDVSEPSSPIMIGLYDEAESALALSVSGNYGYVVGEGLEVIDISDLENPVRAGKYDTYECTGVYVSGQYAYVADYDWNSGLLISDISNPSHPDPVGSLETEFRAVDVMVPGDYAYVNENLCVWGICFGYIEIIDVSNPAVPDSVGVAGQGLINSFFVSGNYAYCAWSSHFGSALYIIDVSDPDSTFSVGGLESIDCEGIPPFRFGAVFVSGSYLYANFCGHLIIWDISDPYNGSIVGSIMLGCSADYTDIFVAGDYAYEACDEGGLVIIDVANPSDPYLVGSFDTQGPARDVFVSGHYAYVAERDSGLQIIDVSEPENPVLAGSYKTPGYARRIYLQDDLIYVADRYSLMILRFNPQTGIEEAGDLPRQLALNQNYPNPFNASTRIEFYIPALSDVDIAVYDILGRRVTTLFHGQEQPGHHSLVWEAGDNPSGIYFARLKAGSRNEAIRMTLLK